MTLHQRYLVSSFKYGRPYAFDKRLVCPKCSEFEDAKTGLIEYAITKPVFFIVKINKKTKQKFLGCPNFPKCRCSNDVFTVRQAKTKIKNFCFDYNDELRPY